MDAQVQRMRKEWIKPADVSAVTFLLAPVDLVVSSSGAFLTWPFFFKYDIEGDKLIEVLKKICIWYPHLCGRVDSSEETRFGVKVTPIQTRNNMKRDGKLGRSWKGRWLWIYL